MTERVVEYGWNSNNEDYEEIESLSLKLATMIPENDAEGTSVFGSRVRSQLVACHPTLTDYHFLTTSREVDEHWQAIEGFLFALGRRYGSFNATAFVTDSSHFSSRIEGVLIRYGQVRRCILPQADWNCETQSVEEQEPAVVFEARSLTHVPVTHCERLFDLTCPSEVDWVREGL